MRLKEWARRGNWLLGAATMEGMPPSTANSPEGARLL